MYCHICRNSNIQGLINTVFNALLEHEKKANLDFEELGADLTDFDFREDVDEAYNGAHGIWVRVNGKYYYVTVEEAETDAEILDDLFNQ
jgi:hypothetical protein